MQTAPLTNAQLEILKQFAIPMSGEELADFRRELARYFAEKTIRAANTAAERKGLTQKDFDSWLDED